MNKTKKTTKKQAKKSTLPKRKHAILKAKKVLKKGAKKSGRTKARVSRVALKKEARFSSGKKGVKVSAKPPRASKKRDALEQKLDQLLAKGKRTRFCHL